MITAVILLGAILYLFSTMPDAERVAGAEKAVADLRSQVAALQSKPAAVDTSALSQRIDASDRQLAALKADVSALQTRLATPAAAEPGANTGEAAAQMGVITAKVADNERSLGDLRTAEESVKKQADGLGQQLGALAAKVNGLPKIDLGPLVARLDSLDGRLKPIEDEFKAAKSPDRVTQVRQNGSAAETRAAPLAVTSDAVLRSIDAGQPFTQNVKVLASLGADPGSLQPLRAVADTGAPTTKDLRSDLATLRDQVSTQSAPTPTGSYLDRLMSGAATMVRVRPLGSVVGDSPPAILARMDDDLARDDLPAALGEWQKLPESTRAIGKGLAERIRLRQAAQAAARAIGASAIQAMVSDQP